jgi:hypothetical protein
MLVHGLNAYGQQVRDIKEMLMGSMSMTSSEALLKGGWVWSAWKRRVMSDPWQAAYQQSALMAVFELDGQAAIWTPVVY